MLNMRRHHIVPLCLCLLGTVSTARAVLNHHAGVFEPDAGVVCVCHRGFCADAQGQADVFILSDGRRCERSARTCWCGRDHAVPDTGLTRHLYGSGI